MYAREHAHCKSPGAAQAHAFQRVAFFELCAQANASKFILTAGNENVFTKTTPPSPVKPAPFDVDAHELDDPKAKDNIAGDMRCLPAAAPKPALPLTAAHMLLRLQSQLLPLF